MTHSAVVMPADGSEHTSPRTHSVVVGVNDGGLLSSLRGAGTPISEDLIMPLRAGNRDRVEVVADRQRTDGVFR
jgi:hypothetical protein